MTYDITTTIPVTGQQIADAMVTAIEGGSTYWCNGIDTHTDAQTKGHERYSLGSVYEQPFKWTVTDDEGVEHLFDNELVKRGLTLLANDHPTFWNDMVGADGDLDADGADTFFQLCVFGEVVYG